MNCSIKFRILVATLALTIVCTVIFQYSFKHVTKPLEISFTKETALIPASTWPEFIDDADQSSLRNALSESLSYLKKDENAAPVQFGPVKITRIRLIEALKGFLDFLNTSPSSSEISSYLHEHFTLYTSADTDVLFTGYYIPHLYGSLTKTDRFQYPIYSSPPDLVEIALSADLLSKLPKDFPVINRGRLTGKKVSIPYYSRSEINSKKVLDNKDLELLWVDDPISLFFLHIQGSGNIELTNGDVVQVGYANKNGMPYKAIGNSLLERGLLEKQNINMFTIRKVLRENPSIVEEILNSNQSYVFFRKLTTKPLGSLGVPVTAERTIATDASLFPKGALALIQSEKPVFDSQGNIMRWDTFSRLMFNQDTGGAIRGAGHVDIFLGEGRDAEISAGLMQQKGRLFFLSPNNGE